MLIIRQGLSFEAMVDINIGFGGGGQIFHIFHDKLMRNNLGWGPLNNCARASLTI